MSASTGTSSGELLCDTPAFLPVLVQGETLFSFAARYHRLCGNLLAKGTSAQLFGSSCAGLRHDFPSHIDQLVEITRGLIGDAQSIAYERSLFGFFAPFQDTENAKNILNQMRGCSIKKVKSALGLLPSRLGAFFPLKACSDCIRDDIKKYSVSIWHMEHQWPSVWICRKHNKVLQALKRELQPKELRRWLLPEDIAEHEWEGISISSPTIKSRLTWVAELSMHIAQLNGFHFDHKLLRYTYLLRAKKHGWLFTDGSAKFAQVRQLFLKYYLGMDCIPGFEIVQAVQAQHGGLLGLLMRQYECRRHPVKHLLLIAFLFESITDFETTYKKIQQTHEEGGDEALQNLVGEEWRAKLKQLVEIEHKSLSSAALAIGISLRVAIRVAKQDGIAYQKRQRVYNTTLGDQILEMISKGHTYDDVLKRTGIKKSLLKDLMAREPAIREAWRNMSFELRRGNYRKNFLSLLNQHRGVPIKKLRTVPGNGVSWLYRNDRKWLIENLPCM